MSASPLSDVSVNGQVIPAAAIATEARNQRRIHDDPGHAWRAAAQALALRAALLDAACAAGLVAVPRVLSEGRVETAEEALIRQLIEASVVPEPVDERSLREAYDRDPGRFRAPDLWEVAHILVAAPPDDPVARSNARALAVLLITEITAHPKRFAPLAAEHSACPSRSSGGCLGQVGPGETVREFEAALRTMVPGQMALEPVETRYGLHVVRLDAHAAGAVLPFAAVLPRLRAAAEKAAWVRAARAFAGAILSTAEVKGLPDALH